MERESALRRVPDVFANKFFELEHPGEVDNGIDTRIEHNTEHVRDAPAVVDQKGRAVVSPVLYPHALPKPRDARLDHVDGVIAIVREDGDVKAEVDHGD